MYGNWRRSWCRRIRGDQRATRLAEGEIGGADVAGDGIADEEAEGGGGGRKRGVEEDLGLEGAGWGRGGRGCGRGGHGGVHVVDAVGEDLAVFVEGGDDEGDVAVEAGGVGGVGLEMKVGGVDQGVEGGGGGGGGKGGGRGAATWAVTPTDW